MLICTAKFKSNNNKGIMNKEENSIFDKKVNNEIFHAFLSFCISLSFDICILRESESESATAIIITPPITAVAEFVLAFRPIMSPRVVNIPETSPKLNPNLNEPVSQNVFLGLSVVAWPFIF